MAYLETYEKLQKNGLFLNPDDVERICKKYRIKELSVFGSALRDDFSEESDVDLLILFINNFGHTLLDIVDIKDEFKLLLDKEIDLAFKDRLKYPVRRENILSTSEILYAC
jgi:hypothetical protein